VTSQEIQKLKELNPILDVASDLGINVVRGKARCIFPENHTNGDKTPSMTINNNGYKCWACHDVGGDVISLVMQTQSLTFNKALDWLNDRVGGALENIETVKIIDTPKPVEEEDWSERTSMICDMLELCKPLHGPELEYIESRGISREVVDNLGIVMIHDYNSLNTYMKNKYTMSKLVEYGFFGENGSLKFYKHRIIFPYYDDYGIPVYFQARAIDGSVKPKEMNLKGSIPVPYNVGITCSSRGLVYICEGVIDALTMIQNGFPAVSVPGVNAFKRRWIPMFSGKRVVIAFDSDAAGRAAAQKLNSDFRSEGVSSSILRLPNNKDVNEWINKLKSEKST
jgi:DNA primase catalytic core